MAVNPKEVAVPADWLLTGGPVVTFDPAVPETTALAVAAGRVLALGDEALALAGPETKRTDLGGAVVLPGFCDTHIHFEKVSHELTMLELGHTRSLAEVLAKVGERANGSWIRCIGDNAGWHERNLAEGRLPSRAELDEAAGDSPVFLYRRPDRAALNSAAIARLADTLSAFSADEWDPETGLLRGAAVRVVNDGLFRPELHDPEHRLAMLAQASRRLLGMGVTSVVDPGLPGGFDASWRLYEQARRNDLVAQRVLLMNRIDWREPFDEEFDRVTAAAVPPGTGDDRLRAWAIKIILDGEFVGAWMRGSAEGARYSTGELTRIMEFCARRDWPICLHAMGGGAIEAVIDAVRRTRPRPGRVSIAHAFLIEAEDVAACAELGIRVSVQPALAYTYAREMRESWGALARNAVPLGMMARHGFRFAGGSDTHPCDPLTGAMIAVTRKAWDGSDLGEREALTAAQALAMYTRDAGHYTGSPELGVLAPGAKADFVVWPVDPLRRAPETWPGLRPELVAIDGRPVWADEKGQ